MSFAALSHQNRVFFTTSEPSGSLFSSALVRLIQGIYEFYPEHARSLMRKRILTNQPLSPLDYCTLKVAAKRVTILDCPDSDLKGLFGTAEFTPVSPLGSESLEPARQILTEKSIQLSCAEGAFEFLDGIIQSDKSEKLHRFERDRPVGCALADEKGKVLSLGFNAGSKNKTLHAEIQMLRLLEENSASHAAGPLVLYTTLKPCRMCAAALYSWMHARREPDRLQVIYRDFDPGPNGRATLLDPGSHDFNAFRDLKQPSRLSQAGHTHLRHIQS